jgi:hypothetical protein
MVYLSKFGWWERLVLLLVLIARIICRLPALVLGLRHYRAVRRLDREQEQERVNRIRHPEKYRPPL